MPSPSFDFIDAITEHSAGFALAANGNLDAEVEHCPGWTVADLVAHVTEVQWFWGTIVDELLQVPPDEARRPSRAPREKLIETFQSGAERLASVLRRANGEDSVYTWAPTQKNVAFVTRHQVQEAAIHHWDAVHAAGGTLTIAAPVAADSISEFLAFSVSSEDDPAEPARPALNGVLGLCCSDADAAWVIRDAGTPGTTTHTEGATGDVPTIAASASELILWLYGRVDLDTSPVMQDLVERFRALCFTD